MNRISEAKRRTVLKTVGTGVAGGAVLTGRVGGHGNDHRIPAWFDGNVAEMGEHPPFGDLEDESTVPIWTIEPGADGKSCPQVEGFDLSVVEDSPKFEDGAWGSVDFDHTLSANPFSALWHVHFIFEGGARSPYTPSDLENQDHNDDPLTDGQTIREATNVTEVSIPFGFNCPVRPADEDHANYCD